MKIKILQNFLKKIETALLAGVSDAQIFQATNRTDLYPILQFFSSIFFGILKNFEFWMILFEEFAGAMWTGKFAARVRGFEMVESVKIKFDGFVVLFASLVKNVVPLIVKP